MTTKKSCFSPSYDAWDAEKHAKRHIGIPRFSPKVKISLRSPFILEFKLTFSVQNYNVTVVMVTPRYTFVLTYFSSTINSMDNLIHLINYHLFKY